MRVYIFIVGRVGDDHPRVGCVLAADKNQAFRKAMAAVREEFGSDANVQHIAPITPPLNLRRFARTEIVRSLCACDKALLACVVVDDLTTKMVDVLEYQKNLVGILQIETEERLRVFEEQQNKDT